MRYLFALLLVPAIADAQPLQWALQQRNALNTAYLAKPCGTSPAADQFLYRENATDSCKWVTFGSHITFSGGALNATGFATTAQGALADSAVQPGSLAPVATLGTYASLTGLPTLFDGTWTSLIGKPVFATVSTSGAYADLSGRPTLGTASAENVVFFATAAQGAKADTAIQPAGLTWSAIIGKPSFGALATQNDVSLLQINDLTGIGLLLTSATTQSSARSAIGAGTSNFDGQYSSLTGAPSIPAAFTAGYPTTRTVALATAYQCTNTAKPCSFTVTLSSTASLSLAGGTTNTADVLVGSTSGVATGTGTVIAKYSNTMTGTLIVGLGVNTNANSSYSVIIPAGGFFAVRQTAGTISVVSAYDQVIGS